MTREQYNTQRTKLMNDMRAAIDAGDTATANSCRDQVRALDNQWEAEAQARADFAALQNSSRSFTPDQEERWSRLIALRNDVNKALELSRGEKIIGKPLDAHITLYVSEETKAAVERIAASMPLTTYFIVSEVETVYGKGEGYEGEEFKGVTVAVKPCEYPRCVRCWTHSQTVGSDSNQPELCARCAQAISE